PTRVPHAPLARGAGGSRLHARHAECAARGGPRPRRPARPAPPEDGPVLQPEGALAAFRSGHPAAVGAEAGVREPREEGLRRPPRLGPPSVRRVLGLTRPGAGGPAGTPERPLLDSPFDTGRYRARLPG